MKIESQWAGAVFTIAGCQINPSRNVLSLNETEVVLEPRVMDTLVALADLHGEVLSRDKLIGIVWDGRVVSDEAVNRCIFELRKAFRELGVSQEVIATVRKRGYELTSPPLMITTDLKSTRSGSDSKKWRWVAIFIVMVSMAWWAGKQSPKNILTIPGEEAQVLQVLPFENRAGDNHGNLLASTLQEGVLLSLSRQPALVVRVPKPENAALLSLPEDQQADYTLQAGLIGDESTRSLQVSLSDHAGVSLWRDTLGIQTDLSNLSVLQRELTVSVIKALNVELKPVDECSWTNDVEALAEYFEAGRLVSLRGLENIRKAISLFQRATERDQQFAQAWSGLSRALWMLPVYVEGDEGIQERARSQPMGEAAAHKALSLCPGLAPAYQLVGDTPEYDGDNGWIEGEYRLRHAFELNPSDGEAARHYSDILYRTGRIAEHAEMLEHAYRVDPMNARIAMQLAGFAINQGDFERAAYLLEQTRKLGNTFNGPMLEHHLAIKSGDWEKARQIVTRYPPQMQSLMVPFTQWMEDNSDEELRGQIGVILRTMLEQGSDDGAILAHMFGLFIGDLDLSYEAYDAMRRDNFNFITLWMSEYPEFRRDPRFTDLVNELGLLEYWQHFGPPDYCKLQGEELDCFQ